MPAKMNGDWDFCCTFMILEEKRADDWLVSNFDRLGIESSIDFQILNTCDRS